MEAANKGASRVKGARNMGMGITLPFEEGGLVGEVKKSLFFWRSFWSQGILLCEKYCGCGKYC